MRYISLSTIFTIMCLYIIYLFTENEYFVLSPKKEKNGGSWLAKGNPGNRKGLSWLKRHIVRSWGEAGTHDVFGDIDLIACMHSLTHAHRPSVRANAPTHVNTYMCRRVHTCREPHRHMNPRKRGWHMSLSRHSFNPQNVSRHPQVT